MPICHNDATFTSDDPEDIKLAVALCVGCPFIQECGEAGLGEKWGVWGGMAPYHPDRKAQRAIARKTKKTHCINGHAIEDYGWDVASGGEKPLVACRRCAALLLHIAEAEPGTLMPETAKRPYLPTQRVVTEREPAPVQRSESLEWDDDRPGMIRVHVAQERARKAADRYVYSTLHGFARARLLGRKGTKMEVAESLAVEGYLDADGCLRDGWPERGVA